MSSRIQCPPPSNEPVLEYRAGSVERKSLQAKLAELSQENVDIPLIINGEEVRTGRTKEIRSPHRRDLVLGQFHQAAEKEVVAAVKGAKEAYKTWSRMEPGERAAIFLRAAELISGKYRALLNGATMLGQSKTCHQAEIDSACELIDFLRFNVSFAQRLAEVQPQSAPGMWNRLEYRPLEGFVFAVTPFNFTAIAGNLPSSPALMGNVSLWKPASTAVYSGYFFMQILQEAGLPPGVIQFLPGSGAEVGAPAMAQPDLAGVHFTGSTGVFQGMWKAVGENISNYKTYPRIVGETGGKDFIFAHPSAHLPALVAASVRGAFEYQGQKCSAASRAYIPKSLWGQYREMLAAEVATVKMGM